MTDLTPRTPTNRPLLWSDMILDLQDALLALSISDPLYIVGGAVRDALLHRPTKDIDLATPTQSIAIARQIANQRDGDIYVMDDERGVARVLIDTPDGRMVIDVANFREADLLADLQERDFTINAMACDLLGDLNKLIDPLGGEADLNEKRLRRCSPHALADDPIRTLRAVRQSVQLGFRLDPATREDCRAHAVDLMTTSNERVRDEFFALLSLQRATAALRVAEALGLLQQIIPPLAQLKGQTLPAPHVYDGWKHTLESVTKLSHLLTTISYSRTDNTAATFGMGMVAMQFDRYRSQLNAHIGRTFPDQRSYAALMMLAALLHRIPDHAGQIANTLRLSNPEKQIIVRAIKAYQQVLALDHTDDLSLHRYWHRHQAQGIDVILLALAVYLATYGNELRQDDWLLQVERATVMLAAFYDRHETLVAPPPLLDGRDLMRELDLDGGRMIGDLLTIIREGQVTGAITTREQALHVAREHVQAQ